MRNNPSWFREIESSFIPNSAKETYFLIKRNLKSDCLSIQAFPCCSHPHCIPPGLTSLPPQPVHLSSSPSASLGTCGYIHSTKTVFPVLLFGLDCYYSSCLNTISFLQTVKLTDPTQTQPVSSPICSSAFLHSDDLPLCCQKSLSIRLF